MTRVFDDAAPAPGGRRATRSKGFGAVPACAVGAALLACGLVVGCLWGPGAVRSVSPTLAADLGLTGGAADAAAGVDDGYGGLLARRVGAVSSDIAGNVAPAPSLDDATAGALGGLAASTGSSGAFIDADGLDSLESALRFADSFSSDGGRSAELAADWGALDALAASGSPDISRVRSSVFGRVGVISFDLFANGTAADVERALVELAAAGADRAVVDLRHNIGGLLGEAAQCAALFLDGGTAFEMCAADEVRRVPVASGGVVFDGRVVLLVSERTAGAAEAFVAALAGHGRADVAGTGAATAGVGEACRIRTLSFGGAVRYCVGLLRTPDGDAISDVGLTIPERGR